MYIYKLYSYNIKNCTLFSKITKKLPEKDILLTRLSPLLLHKSTLHINISEMVVSVKTRVLKMFPFFLYKSENWREISSLNVT